MIYINKDGLVNIEIGSGDVSIGAGELKENMSYIRFGQLEKPKKIGYDLLKAGIESKEEVVIIFKNEEALEVLQKALNKAREIINR